MRVPIMNRDGPGKGTDHLTVPGDVQSLAPAGQVSVPEPVSGEPPRGDGAAQPAASATAASAAAVNPRRSGRLMSLTPLNLGIS